MIGKEMEMQDSEGGRDAPAKMLSQVVHEGRTGDGGTTFIRPALAQEDLPGG